MDVGELILESIGLCATFDEETSVSTQSGNPHALCLSVLVGFCLAIAACSPTSLAAAGSQAAAAMHKEAS